MSGGQILAGTHLRIRLLKDDHLKQIDVSEESQVKDLVAKAVSWGGRLDIWVNNAAKFVFGEVTTATDAGKLSLYCSSY